MSFLKTIFSIIINIMFNKSITYNIHNTVHSGAVLNQFFIPDKETAKKISEVAADESLKKLDEQKREESKSTEE